MPCIPNKWQNPKLTSDMKNMKSELQFLTNKARTLMTVIEGCPKEFSFHRDQLN